MAPELSGHAPLENQGEQITQVNAMVPLPENPDVPAIISYSRAERSP